MSKIRFGFIGAGKITVSSAQSTLSHKSGAVTAIHDLSEERRQALANEFDIPNSFATAEELFSCKEVDAVYIAVPNKFHASLAIQALEAGKHVLLEKPFAMNAREAAQVIETAKKSGKVFALGMNQRYCEDSQKIKSLCQQGALGEVYYAKAYWLRRQGIPSLGTWFGKKELAGAGAINDIGVHMLDLCLHLIDNFEPVSAYGTTYTKFGDRGLGEGNWGWSDKTETVFDVDDLATALIKMKNGATISLEAAWACHTGQKNLQNVELFGTEAGASAYPAKLYKSDPLDADYQVIENINAKPALPHCDRFHNFINHLLGTEDLLVKAEEALVTQKILDAIAASCSTGKAVEI